MLASTGQINTGGSNMSQSSGGTADYGHTANIAQSLNNTATQGLGAVMFHAFSSMCSCMQSLSTESLSILGVMPVAVTNFALPKISSLIGKGKAGQGH
jgi:hypothetical protein